MNKSITQATQDDKQISCKSIRPRKAYISFWFSNAYSWMVRRKYISAGKRHPSFYRKREKPNQ